MIRSHCGILHIPCSLARRQLQSRSITNPLFGFILRLACMFLYLHADKTLPGFLLLKSQLQIALFKYWRGFQICSRLWWTGQHFQYGMAQSQSPCGTLSHEVTRIDAEPASICAYPLICLGINSHEQGRCNANCLLNSEGQCMSSC